jgi:hypothetical protein
MNQYMNEELMWERLKDIQREVENSRLHGSSRSTTFRPGRWLAGLFLRRARVTPVGFEDKPSVSDVA